MTAVHSALLKITTALIAAGVATGVQAEYPDRPIKIFVPFAVGGVADLLARVVASKITEQTGKVVIVDNKSGAGGRIGYEAGAKAVPDGYTFVATDVTYTMMPSLYPTLSWDASSDLVPVSLLAHMPFVVTVRDEHQAETLQQFVAKAKKQGGKLNYGSAGIGSVNHVVTELFERTAGVQMVHVPYRGMGEAISALIGGSVDVLVTAMPTAMGQLKAGRLAALAVTSIKRSSALPDLPTSTEGGVPFVASNWIGLTAPKKTPKDAVSWMAKAVSAAVATPDVARNFQAQGAEPSAVGADEMGRLMRTETARWGDVIRAANIVAN
jgi:tripartite-type tricarboxylate transporter receptor subunit TctC